MASVFHWFFHAISKLMLGEDLSGCRMWYRLLQTWIERLQNVKMHCKYWRLFGLFINDVKPLRRFWAVCKGLPRGGSKFWNSVQMKLIWETNDFLTLTLPNYRNKTLKKVDKIFLKKDLKNFGPPLDTPMAVWHSKNIIIARTSLVNDPYGNRILQKK